jgi:hypothetical protein
VPTKRPKPLPKPKATHERHAKASVAHLDQSHAKALLPTLDRALNEVAEYVARARTQAVEADQDGAELAADGLRHNAQHYAPAAPQEFHDAAWRLVRLVTLALGTGDTSNVVWLARYLDKRRVREWVLTCERRLFFRRPGFDPSELRKDLEAEAIKYLADDLTWIEPNAAKLTPDHVAKALSGRASTAVGVAARLACDCGAFGYRTFAEAKSAFAKAAKLKISRENS